MAPVIGHRWCSAHITHGVCKKDNGGGLPTSPTVPVNRTGGGLPTSPTVPVNRTGGGLPTSLTVPVNRTGGGLPTSLTVPVNRTGGGLPTSPTAPVAPWAGVHPPHEWETQAQFSAFLQCSHTCDSHTGHTLASCQAPGTKGQLPGKTGAIVTIMSGTWHHRAVAREDWCYSDHNVRHLAPQGSCYGRLVL